MKSRNQTTQHLPAEASLDLRRRRVCDLGWTMFFAWGMLACGEDSRALVDAGMRVDAGSAMQVTTEALIDHRSVTLTSGTSEPVVFTLPDDALSLTIVVEGRDEGEYTLADWADDSGFQMVRPRWWDTEDYACRTCNNTVEWQRGALAVVAPDNPASQLNPGMHSMVIHGSGLTEEVTLTVWAKRGDTLPETGVVDYHFYFSGAYGWTAQNAPQTQYFQAVMARVDEVLANAGVRVGDVTFEDIGAEFQIINHTWGPDNDLDALLKLSAGRDSRALNVFFVDELYSGSSTEPRAMDPIIGLSPAPGPPLTHGTVNSGLVVSTWSTLSIPEEERWPNALAHTIAHETGHHIGLVHTTEFDGITHDRLPDSPEDDRGNLMHAEPDPEQGTLSPWQSRVIRGSAWVRHSSR